MKFGNLEVERIYCINLEERTDRRQHMEMLAARMGWEITFLPGIKVNHKDEHHTAGMIGCFQSHASIYRMAQERGYSSYVVLEDDIDFIPGGEYLLEKATENIPAEADFLFFGFVQDGGLMAYNKKINDYWVSPGAGWGCHAYAVLNQKTTESLVSGTQVMRMEIDRQLIHLVLPVFDVNHCMQLPPPFFQQEMGTNVQTHRKNEHTGIH